MLFSSLRWLNTFLYVVALWLMLAGSSLSLADRSERVLLIYSCHPTSLVSDSVLAGIQSVLGQRDSVVLDVEFMDAVRHGDHYSQQHFLTGLKYRLSGRPDYDLVMVAGNAALALAGEHHQTLFRESPLVFLGVKNQEYARELSERGIATGVIAQPSVLETLRLMRQLVPERKQVHIVSDDTPIDQPLLDQTLNAFRRIKGLTPHVLSLQHLRWSELNHQLQHLDDDDTLLLLSARQDADGISRGFSESLQEMLAHIQVPVFHLWEHGMGEGILGGAMVSHFEQGRVAAEYAEKILGSTPVSHIPALFKSPNILQVDVREALRLGIDELRIPDNAVRLYDTPSFLDRHQTSVVWALSMLPILIGLLFFLWRQGRSRLRLSRKLSDKQMQLSLLIRTIPDLVWFKDLDGRYIMCNRAMEEFLGVEEARMAGKTVHELFDASIADAIQEIDQTVMNTRSPHTFEQHMKSVEGKASLDIETIRVPFFDAEGTLQGVLGIGRDITRRVAAEQHSQEREALLSAVINEMPELFSLKDAAGRFLLCNDNVARQYGSVPEAMVGKNEADLGMSPALASEIKEHVCSLMEYGRSEMVYEDSIDAESGEVRHYKSTRKPIIDGQGGRQIIVIAQDITDLARAQQRLRENEQKLNRILDGVDAYIYLKDTSGNYLFVNRLVRELWQLNDAEILGKSDETFFDQDSVRLIRDMDNRVLNHGETVKSEEYITPSSTGQSMSFQVTKMPLRNEQGDIYALCGISVDMTARLEYQRQLEHMAHYDVLTGILNRSYFSQILQEQMIQARHCKGTLLILYIDLDGFKQLNDTHGHDVGDHFLACMARRLQDVLGEQATLARYGGDEFITVMPHVFRKNMTDNMLQRILDELSESVAVDGLLLRVTASIGVTHYPQQEEQDADQMVRQANRAMFDAKMRGKNRYHYFDSELSRRIADRTSNLKRLEKALENNEFELYFQPKVNMKTGKVIGAEALIRWCHPTRGILPPGLFLPDTETDLLGVKIGDWVIAKALSTLSEWQAQGCLVPISVNVSNLQLSQTNFVEKLAQNLDLYPNLKPGSLEMEILETSSLYDLSEVTKTIHQCEVMGVYFSLDDFGTGYSSMTYLKQLPARQLKIDRSFVQDILKNPDDLTIVKGVFSLASAFGMEVVAEGVEEEEHGCVLLALGCELGQGYGIARPMPVADFSEWMEKWQPPECWLSYE
ncbi:MAG: EAL domain-containing protein [Oceanobacter sp.]